VRPNGSGLKEISKHIEDNLPYWSSRNNGLAFSSTMHGDKQSRVYVIDRVPFEGRQQEGRPLNFGPDDVRGENPAWTADDRVVYKGCDSTVEPARCGLFVIASAKGAHPATQLTEHTEDTAPATSGIPGDGRIAFMSSRDGNWEIYIMNADGSGLKRLTRDPAHDGLPAWSPDGKSLAFVSDQGGAWAVWIMSPDGSNRRKLFDLGGGGLAFEWQNEQISWGP
jgi:Tol biopolymer transport system component